MPEKNDTAEAIRLWLNRPEFIYIYIISTIPVRSHVYNSRDKSALPETRHNIMTISWDGISNCFEIHTVAILVRRNIININRLNKFNKITLP
jgi:hypothetical protein